MRRRASQATLAAEFVLLLAAMLLAGPVVHAEEMATRAEAEAMVKKASAFVKANGKDKSFAEFNELTAVLQAIRGLAAA